MTDGFGGGDIHFADINGDGKADYLVVGSDGAVKAWLNQGKDDKGFSWKSIGEIAAGAGEGDEIQFADLDGDGKADYLIVDKDNGSVAEYLNGGQKSDGGWEWLPKGQVVEAHAKKGEQVQFASLNGDKKDDYLVVDVDSNAVSLWINKCVT